VRTIANLVGGLLAILLVSAPARAQQINWTQVEQQATATLQQYIRINTTDPPSNTVKSADLLESIFKREGIPVTRYVSAPGKAIILARLKGSGQGRPILLLNHMDVVPADASRWREGVFSGTILNGEMWGRGAMDMKGLGVIELYAMLALKRSGVHLTRDVLFEADPDEEIGGAGGARWMIAHHWAELNPEYVLDEGAFGSRDLYVPNKLVFGISVEEKRVVWIRVTATGVSGHASQPTDQNPNDELVKALARLVSAPMPTGSVAIINRMKATLGTLSSNKFMNAIQHSTIALTTMKAGEGSPAKVNVIPGTADATLDCRLLPGVNPAGWVALITRRLDDPKLKVDVMYQSEGSTLTPTDTPMYHALESAIRRVHPDATVVPVLVPYGTDSNTFREHGAKSYGLYPIIAPTELVNTMHGDNERMPVAQLKPGIQIVYDMLRQVAGGK